MMESLDSLLTPRYPIRAVVRRSGLGASVLRAWERRYKAVTPGRSEGGQRLYSEADLRKLILLRELVGTGHNISRIASLDLPELEAFLESYRARDTLRENGTRRGSGADRAVVGEIPRFRGNPSGSGAFLEAAVGAVLATDPRELEHTLNRAALALGTDELVDDLIVPLLARIGTLWEEGLLGPGKEHAASGGIQRFLGWLLGTLNGNEGGPVLMVGTPTGHRHEFGALLAAVIGAAEGWTVITLGADLPGSEIASAARARDARVVAVSAIHPVDDGTLVREVRELIAGLPDGAEVLVGGPGAMEQRVALEGDGARVLASLGDLRAWLRKTRPAEVLRR